MLLLIHISVWTNHIVTEQGKSGGSNTVSSRPGKSGKDRPVTIFHRRLEAAKLGKLGGIRGQRKERLRTPPWEPLWTLRTLGLPC